MQFVNRIRRLTYFIGTAAASQALAAAFGVILVRWLDVDKYAQYTIAVATITSIAVLSTSGANLAFSQLLGQHWGQKNNITRAYGIVLHTRKRISLIVVPIFLAICYKLLSENDRDPISIGVIIFTIIILAAIDVNSRQLEQILVFAKEAIKIQRLDAAAGATKIALALTLYQLGQLSILAIMAMLASVAYGRQIILRQISKRYVDTSTALKVFKVGAESLAVKRIVYRQAPAEIFGCLQPQMLLAILAIAGDSSLTAQYGALGRFAMLLAPFQLAVNAFLIPRFAKLPAIDFRILVYNICLASAPAVGLTIFSLFHPELLLAILGEKYELLTQETKISCGAAALAMIGGTAWGLMAHRGHNGWSWIQIPIYIFWLCGIIFFNKKIDLTDILFAQYATGLGLLCAAALEIYTEQRNRNRHVSREQSKNPQ